MGGYEGVEETREAGRGFGEIGRREKEGWERKFEGLKHGLNTIHQLIDDPNSSQRVEKIAQGMFRYVPYDVVRLKIWEVEEVERPAEEIDKIPERSQKTWGARDVARYAESIEEKLEAQKLAA